MKDFTAFSSLMEEFIALFDSLAAIEQQKLDAVAKDKVSFVEECMNKEQAAILKLRGLELRREQEQERLGMKGFSFRQILEAVSEEERSPLKELFDRLSASVGAFQSVSASAKELIEIKLHSFSQILGTNTKTGFTDCSV